MYQHSTAFADTLDRCFFPPVAKCSRRHCAKRCLTPIRRSWTQAWRSRRLSRLKSRWRRTGVLKDLKPDFAIGHSVGEFAAAVVCGHYTIEQVMPLVCRRGALMQQCASGAMVAVFADEDTLMPLARQFELDPPPTTVRNIRYFPGRAPPAVFCATLSQHDIN